MDCRVEGLVVRLPAHFMDRVWRISGKQILLNHAPEHQFSVAVDDAAFDEQRMIRLGRTLPRRNVGMLSMFVVMRV